MKSTINSVSTPIPQNEENRLEELKSYHIMDTLPEEDYNAIARLASSICEVPIALVSLLDEDRQWFKARVGLGVSETPREISFCQYAIMDDVILEVENALESDLFKDNTLVTGDPKIRFYAGAPLRTSSGSNLGTLCVIDRAPKKLSDDQLTSLNTLANVVVRLIESRKKQIDLEKYKRFFDNSMDMLCIAGTDGYFKELNARFSEVLGYSREELLANPFTDFIHPSDLDSTLKEIEKLSQGNKTVNFINRFQKKDNGYLWFQWNTTPDQNGNLYAVARDITESHIRQKVNEAELIGINNSSFRVDVAPSGKILYANNRFLRAFGYEKEELIGQNHSIFLFDEDLKSKSFKDLYNSVKRGKAYSKKVRRKSKKGKELWIDFVAIPVILEGAVLEKILLIGRDITKEIGAEAELKKLSLVASNTNNAVIITNNNLEIEWINKAYIDLTGYDLEECIGKRAGFIMHNFNFDPNKQKVLRDSLLNGNGYRGEVLSYHKTGSKFWTDLSISPIKDEHGEVEKFIVVASNTTERKEKDLLISKQKETLDRIIQSTKLGTWEWNVQTKSVVINENFQKMIGGAADNLQIDADDWTELIHPDDLKTSNIVLEKHFNRETEFYECEYRMKHTNGTWVWVLASGRVKSWTEDGKPEWMYGTHQEISNLKETELELTRSNKELDQFA